MSKIDKVDEKILLALINDSRQSISQIAKQGRVSRDVVQYRISQLQKKGVIKDFITVMDHEKLGYISALVFFSVKAEMESDFIVYVNSLDFVSWAGTHLGFWSLGMAIYGKSTKEVEDRFQMIFLRYKEHITDHQFAFYKSTQFFTEKYFGIRKTSNARRASVVHLDYFPDDIDMEILLHLSKNSRISSVELAKVVDLTPVAVSMRISKLEKSGYIKGYSIYVSLLQLGIYLFVFFLQNRNLDQRRKLFEYLVSHPRVSLLLDYIGDPFIEFGIFVKDPYEVRAILQEIKGTFPDNQLKDFFLAQEDFISYGVPRCVFG